MHVYRSTAVAIIGVAFALALGAPRAASATGSDTQLWATARVNHGLSRDWAVSMLVRGRFDEDVSHTRDYLLRPYISYTAIENFAFLHNVGLIAGYDRLKSYSGRDEHRAWQSLHHSVDRGGFRLNHRLRLDQRFVDGVDPVIHRLRYRIATTQQIFDWDWYGLLRTEAFFNLNDDDEGPTDGFEQTRTRVGFGRFLGDRLRAEAGYSFQWANRRARADVIRHVVFLEFSLASGTDPRAIRSGTEARRQSDDSGIRNRQR